MATFDKISQPESIEGRLSGSYGEGRFPGWFPATIVSVDDIEKIGRITVQSDIIGGDSVLPTGKGPLELNEGYCYVTEEYTCNSTAGGKHRMLYPGTLVAVIPMMGDLKTLLMIGCIPNRQDRPEDIFNRAEGLYGESTYGGVVKLRNDNDNSSIDSYPQGVTQLVSAGGDSVVNTKGGATIAAMANGSIIEKNEVATFTLSEDGQIFSGNSANGFSILREDGEWEIASSSEAKLELKKGESKLLGPRSPLASLISGIGGKIEKPIQESLSLFGQVQRYIEDSDWAGLIAEAPALLESFQGQIKSIGTVIQDLESFAKNSVEDLGETLINQASQYLNQDITTIYQTIKRVLSTITDPNLVITELVKELPEKYTGNLIPEFGNEISALSHTPEIQIQAILQKLLGDEFEEYKNILGLGVEETLEPVNNFLNSFAIPEDLPYELAVLDPLDLLYSESTQLEGYPQLSEWRKQVKNKVDSFGTLLPKHLAPFFEDKDVWQLVEQALVGTANPLQTFLGKSISKQGDKLLADVAQVFGVGEYIQPIQSLISAANAGDLKEVANLAKLIPGLPNFDGTLDGLIQKIIPQGLNNIFNLSGSIFRGLNQDKNRLINSVDRNAIGGMVKVGSTTVEARAHSKLPSARMRITTGKASLISATGASEVYARGVDAGFATPFGSFGIGPGGSNFLSQVAMAMRIVQSGSKYVGMFLHPQNGASLASYADNGDRDNKLAEITVDEASIKLHSIGNYGIDITPSGIFIEGVRVSRYINDFEGRIRALESMFTPENNL